MKKAIIYTAAIFVLIGLAALVCVFGVQSSQNTAIAKEQLVESSLSDLNAEYNRRSGLLVNLAEAVRSYDEHESEVIVKLSEARTTADGGDVNASAYIKAVVERYPQLRSVENYDRYMTELSMTENRISSHRKYYNTTVRDYTRYVRSFPTRIFLSFLGYQVQDYSYLEFKNAPVDAPTGLLKKDK